MRAGCRNACRYECLWQLLDPQVCLLQVSITTVSDGKSAIVPVLCQEN